MNVKLLSFIRVITVSLYLGLLGYATAPEVHAEEYTRGKFDQSYYVYSSLLNKYVHGSRVDYKGFINSEKEFNRFLESLGSVNEKDFAKWSEEQKLAFWINAYNAFTIKAIMANYPLHRTFSLIALFVPSNSILQIKGVWDKLQFKAVGRMVTLEEIEHVILRKEFNEPRIHIAIVCASVGCPDLRSEAYTAERIDKQLTDASINFINNPSKGLLIDAENRRAKFSKIFKWFGEDFISNYGSDSKLEGRSKKEDAILGFAIKYADSDHKINYLLSNNYKIGYLKYDWHLNETPN